MLEPNDRSTLLELLRPPDDYELDFAIGTTYTLDLLSALTAPVGFTLLELQSKREVSGDSADRLTLLRTIREFADRMVIFCQAGAIAVPAKHQPLFAYLENTVVEVRAPRPGGIFHAKMWVLRFRPVADADAAMAYRLIVPSRNLTFDRSWDTVLTLDGWLSSERQRGYSENRGLDILIRAYRDNATRDLPTHAAEKLATIASEIRRVGWDLPDGFDAIRFWPIGLAGQPAWPFTGRIDRLLVVSPFLTQNFFKKAEKLKETTLILVSQVEALQQFTSLALEPFSEVYSMMAEARRTDSADAPDYSLDGCNGGLHAKLYVADAGRNAAVWTGSANATKAGFGLNVELLVELTGAKGKCGVDAILNGNGDASLRSLLLPFTAQEAVVEDPMEALRCDLEAAQTAIAAVSWRVVIGEPQEHLYLASLQMIDRGGRVEVPVGLTISCWPIALKRETAGREPDFKAEVVAEFGECSLQAITPFIAFELKAEREERSLARSFVIRAELEGAPANRRESILASLLADRSDFLRLLLLLLDTDELALPADGTSGLNDAKGVSAPWRTGSSGLLEALMRALDRDPNRLDHLRGLIDELRRTPEGASVIPSEFDALWAAMWEARESARD
ncbi:MAG: phospholipase D family protein [Gemmatimonadaceae bacterium]